MPDETRHESANLVDYQVEDSADTLSDAPGDDPLDRGVVPPGRWSAAMRFGTTAAQQHAGESLDQLLSEEEPDGEPPEDEAGDATGDDPDAADEYVDGLLLDDGPDPRAGRLVAADEGAHPVRGADLVALDTGIDGGAATAEEAAVHVVEDDGTDVRSGD